MRYKCTYAYDPKRTGGEQKIKNVENPTNPLTFKFRGGGGGGRLSNYYYSFQVH